MGWLTRWRARRDDASMVKCDAAINEDARRMAGAFDAASDDA